MHKNLIVIGPLISFEEIEKRPYQELITNIDSAFKLISRFTPVPTVNLQFHRGHKGVISFKKGFLENKKINNKYDMFVSYIIESFNRFESYNFDVHVNMNVNYLDTAQGKTFSLFKIKDSSPSSHKNAISLQDNAQTFQIVKPYWTFDDIVLSKETFRSIQRHLALVKNEKLVYEQWNLRSIDLFPKCALNYYGPPGTGKTMAAHAVAHQLGASLLLINIAEIESQYVGESAKNIREVFQLAQTTKTVLFLDEADAILGKRISNVSQGSEQAVNSLRSQVLTSLDSFSGIVLFSTNLIGNYDFAFHERIANIKFQLPRFDERVKIWEKHLAIGLPLDISINYPSLSELSNNFSGRDIKNSVIHAVGEILLDNKNCLNQEYLANAINFTSNNRILE